MNFGNKLQLLRKNKGLSQEQLANELNVSRQAVSKWETGEGNPELEKLIQISDVFQVSLDYLVKESESLETVNEWPKPFIKEEVFVSDIEEIEEYIKTRQSFSRKISMGIMIIIISVIFPAIFEHYEEFGAGLMLMVMGIGIARIVLTGISFGYYKKPDFVIAESDHSYLMAEFEQYRSLFSKKIAIGVFLILTGIGTSAMASEFFHSDALEIVPMFILLSLAVYLFVTAGMGYETYAKLLKEEIN